MWSFHVDDGGLETLQLFSLTSGHCCCLTGIVASMGYWVSITSQVSLHQSRMARYILCRVLHEIAGTKGWNGRDAHSDFGFTPRATRRHTGLHFCSANGRKVKLSLVPSTFTSLRTTTRLRRHTVQTPTFSPNCYQSLLCIGHSLSYSTPTRMSCKATGSLAPPNRTRHVQQTWQPERQKTYHPSRNGLDPSGEICTRWRKPSRPSKTLRSPHHRIGRRLRKNLSQNLLLTP